MQGTINVQIGSITATISVELLSTDHLAPLAGHPDDSSDGQSHLTVLYTFNVIKLVWVILFSCARSPPSGTYIKFTQYILKLFDRRPIIRQKWVVACPHEAISSDDDDCHCAAFKSSDDSVDIVHGVGLSCLVDLVSC